MSRMGVSVTQTEICRASGTTAPGSVAFGVVMSHWVPSFMLGCFIGSSEIALARFSVRAAGFSLDLPLELGHCGALSET